VKKIKNGVLNTGGRPEKGGRRRAMTGGEEPKGGKRRPKENEEGVRQRDNACSYRG